jgi:hypothetical protein
MPHQYTRELLSSEEGNRLINFVTYEEPALWVLYVQNHGSTGLYLLMATAFA